MKKKNFMKNKKIKRERGIINNEVLELKTVKDKKVYIYLIKKKTNKLLKDESANLNDLLEKNEFSFATIDPNNEVFTKTAHNSISDFLKKSLIPYFYINIPDSTKHYLLEDLLEEISRDQKQIEELELEYKPIRLNPKLKNSFKARNIKSWIKKLKEQVYEKERNLTFKIKSLWILKYILDLIEIFKEKTLYILHFTTEEKLYELKKMFEEFEIKVIINDISKKVLAPHQIKKR